MWSTEEKEYLFNRLDLIDATLETILKRQWYIASVAFLADNEEMATYMMTAMSDSLDEYQETINHIRDEYGKK